MLRAVDIRLRKKLNLEFYTEHTGNQKLNLEYYKEHSGGAKWTPISRGTVGYTDCLSGFWFLIWKTIRNWEDRARNSMGCVCGFIYLPSPSWQATGSAWTVTGVRLLYQSNAIGNRNSAYFYRQVARLSILLWNLM